MGGIDTGAGGTAGAVGTASGEWSPLLFVGGMALAGAAAGTLLIRRRRAEER